jgi:BNR repeat-like domain
MFLRTRTIVTLAFVAAVLPTAAGGAGGDYAGSNAGIVNIQASTTPITLACPAAAPWNRDPNVCAQRWSTAANDKSESDLAVDPTDPNHIVGMSKAFFSPKDYLFELVWYDSHDGGKTWKSGILPGYESWMDTTDPTIAFDSRGNLYALVLPFNFVIEPSGDHNWDIGHVSPEGLNDGIYLSRSMVADGNVGERWRAPVELATYHASGLGITADKQWVGADTFGKHPGSVYASWIVFDGVALNTVVSVSTDYGAHFSAPQVISQATKPKFNGDPYVFEGPEGNVYVGYDTLPPKQSYTTGAFQVVVSHDNGQTWSKPGQQITTSVGPSPYVPDTFRDGTPYSMTVNPANGNILLAYENYDRSIPKGNVWLTQSSDEGKTWSKSTLVNDASAAGDTTQQKIMAAPNGQFAIAFYDRRLPCPASDPIAADIGKTNTCVDTTIQFYSADGTPLGGNRRVTQESWDPNINPPQPGGLSGSLTFIGDYFGGAMTSSGSSAWAHLLFVSTSAALQAGAVPGGGLTPPYQQQVYARVPAP